MINFGLTDTGFVAPTYDEWLDDIEDDFRSRFGDDLVLTSNSNAGILARMIAWRETEICQQLEMVYYSGFYSTATGTTLDRLGANRGVIRKAATPSHVTIKVETDGEYLIQTGEQFENADGLLFDLTDDLITTKDSDGKWTGTGNLESEDTGAMTNVEANTITIISNPDENVLSVTNPEKAEGGQDDETDEEYRKRLIAENTAKPGATLNGIKSALLNVTGVREVSIVENPTDVTDQYGNLPESVHIYCLGGTKSEIAQALIDHLPAGCVLNGKQSVDAVDATGNKKTVLFDYATDKPVFVQVHIKTDDEWNTDSGADSIKTQIADYINQLEMGQTVFLTKLYPIIYGQDGVEEATVTIGTGKNSLSSSDITTEQFEAPSCGTANIEVVIDG